jgi:transcriptional regulator with XRE-family HTH domain
MTLDRHDPARTADGTQSGSPTSRVPELAAVVADMVAQGLNAPAIARRLGLTDSYVAKLRRISRDVAPEVLLAWRASARPLGVDAMLSVAASTEQLARYGELETSVLDRRGYHATLKRAREYGCMFARLEAVGFRAPMPPYRECISHIFPRLDPKYWSEACVEVERGWRQGETLYDDEEDG